MTDQFFEPSDAELLQRYRDGDDTAAGELYARHHPAAVRLAVSLWGQSRAEDLASDAFVAVMRAVRNGAGPQFAFRPYLLTSVRNAYYAASKSDSRHVWLDDIEESSAPTSVEDGIAVREESSLLAQAFATLPERWQAVLWHTTIHDETPEQVAGTLGLKPSAVTSLAHRAREGLRQAYLAAHLAGTDSAECREIRELLPAYDRDRLGKRQTTQVDAHLDACDECREAAAMLGGITANLGWVLLPAVLGVPGVLAFGSPAAKAAVASGAGAAGLMAGGGTSAGGGAAGGASAGGGAGGAAGGSAGSAGGVLTSTVGFVVAASVVAAAAVGAVVVNEMRGEETVKSASAPAAPPATDPGADDSDDSDASDAPPSDEEEKDGAGDEENSDEQDQPFPTVAPSPAPSTRPTVSPGPVAPRPSPSPDPTTPRPSPSPSPSPSPTPTEPEPEPGVDLVLTMTGEGVNVRFSVASGGLTPILNIEFPSAERWSIVSTAGWQCQRPADSTSGTCTATQADPPDLVLSATSPTGGTPPPPRPISATVYAEDNDDPDESNNSRTLTD